MIRKTIGLIISLLFIFNSAFAFDEQKAKADYKGANFGVASIKESVYENAPAITISFTAPLSKDRLKDQYVTLEGGESDHWIISEDRTKLIFPFVAPQTDYSVHVSSEIRDLNGQKLNHSESKNLKTLSLTPSVNFTSGGHILSSSSPKRLPVTTLNIDEVNIDFFAVDNSKIPGLIHNMGRNGSNWYHTVNRVNQYGKLIHSGRFELKPRKNQRTEYNIDLEGIDSLKAPGLYVAVMNKPGIYDGNFEYSYFMQTNIGLHLRLYDKSFDVYAQDITSGKPIANVKIEVTNLDGTVIETGNTDENGRASFHITSDQHYIIAAKEDQISVLPLKRDALDLSGLKNVVTTHSEYQIYPWGPRNLYRPSEKIEVKMLVRNYDGKLPPSMPLAYTLYKPNGDKVSSDQIQPTKQGFYTFEYQTDDTSQTGTYHLKLSFGATNTVSYYFKVEEFLPERLDLELFDGDVNKKRIIAKKELVEVPISSRYLYGAPASGNKADGFVVAGIDIHPFEDLKTFSFGDTSEKIGYERQKFTEINLADDGTGLLTMENKWSAMKSPVSLNINASVYETGGRPVTRHSSLTMLSGDHFIGIEPQFKEKPDANSTVEIKVGCVNRDGKWIKNKSLQVSLIRQDRNWYWRQNSGRGWHWAWDETPVVVFSKTVNINKTETAIVSLPISWGSYRIEVSDGDSLTSYHFQTAWSWWNNSGNSNAQKPDQISLGFENAGYKPGDLAKLRINPPQDGLALITVESSEGVLLTKYMPVKSEGTDVDIRTDKSWDRHDLYASVMVIRPGDMDKTPVPTRSFGMVHLPLKRDNALLNVEITAPEQVEPSKRVNAKIKVTSDYPLPANTRVVVSLVDVGILNITRFKTPDAGSYFFGSRRYNIDLYDNYGQVIDNLGPKTVLQRFGGGFAESDADIARGGDKPKSEVLMVSFFSEPLPVDENGEVEAGFDVPNFNGKLRWMVMAFADEQFGKTDADTKVADKIVTQLSMPRFLALGDKSIIALDLRNMSGTLQQLSLEMDIDGSLRQLSEKKSISLNDNEKITLRFPIEAIANSGQGEMKLHLYNEDKEIEINRTWRLGVRSPYPSITRTSFAVIAPNSNWKPELPTDDLVPETVGFQMTLSNKPPIDLASHFTYLLHYPYGCLEQSTSSGYPWVLATPEAISEMGLSKQVKNQFNRDYDEQFRAIQIEAAVRLVLDRQKSNGGFGLWSSDSPEEKWLTVYAAEFLNDAKRAGASVSADSLQNTNVRLRKYLHGDFPKNHNRWSENIDHYEFAFRSYAGYVLAKAGLVGLSDLRRLAEQYEGKTNDDGLSWQYMAASFKLAGDAKNADTCFNLAMKERERPKYSYYGEYGSNVRDLARITELVLAHGFEGSGNLLLDLTNAVKERQWLSTQERISLFRTALLMEKSGGDTWGATLVTDQLEQKLERNRAFNTLFDLKTYQSLQKIEAGSNTLYANMTLVGESEKAPEPQFNEITITRKFYDTNGNSLILDQMKSGELAVVQLDISSKKRTPDGLVVDLLPAGVEIENQNLGVASIKLDEIKIDGKTIGEIKKTEYVIHEEFRDDRYVAAINIDTYRSITLFYLIRAVTPGVYKMPCSYVEDMYRPYRFAIGATQGQIEIFE
ncbi:MAG: alpha-2-macroglobulin family protein [Proteobacteria bacterium]|nr:alpha-2-macroglobulin family protein [Pseudomonadota bacterium]